MQAVKQQQLCMKQKFSMPCQREVLIRVSQCLTLLIPLVFLYEAPILTTGRGNLWQAPRRIILSFQKAPGEGLGFIIKSNQYFSPSLPPDQRQRAGERVRSHSHWVEGRHEGRKQEDNAP